MGLPGHRRTSSHKRRRASHFALVAKTLSVCPKCSARRLPHMACSNCGFYKDRDILRLTREIKKSSAKDGSALALKDKKLAAKK